MVTCPNCGSENGADARFCSQCGNSLSITCPVCSHPASPEDRFCSNCGSALRPDSQPAAREDLARYLPEELLAKMRSARAGKAMLGERRTVTMLFADITGSTAAAEQLDPEDWAEIMNGAFGHLIEPIYRYEGTLAQLRGDAILAFFGAPIAHEDDPVRALRAAVEMVEAMRAYSREIEGQWGIPVQIRVGVNTGLVVVGEMGSDLRVEYSALGDAINVAARMEQTAEPGTVRVTEHTVSLTGGAFEVEELGGVQVKGKSDPVVSFRVDRYIGVDRATGDRPVFGRNDELARLDGIRDTLMAGSGWIASIIADGGVGKSRLISEFRARSAAQHGIAAHPDESGDLNWLRGTSRSYESTIPFSTIRDMLRRWWGIEEADGFEQVAEAVGLTDVDDPDAPALLAQIAGVPLPEEAQAFIDALETPALHGRSAEALMSYVGSLASRRPTIIVAEDLHWADDLSLALIEGLMALTENSTLGLLVAMRPYRDEAPWRIHEVAAREYPHRYHHLDLAPLGDDSGKALLDSLVDSEAIPPETVAMILERSDGNPLFIEEMARSVVESDAGPSGELPVPSNLTGILTARLDRLPEEARYVVQVASVLGSEFNRETLSFLVGNGDAGSHLPDLLRKGILIETGDRGASLAFRHALIQENAYETILRRTRRSLHRQIADYLRDVTPDDAPAIARHFEEAGDLMEAFPYLVEAGRRAARAMALGDAIRLVATAIDNIPANADPEMVEQAHETLGEAYALVPDLSQAAAAYQSLYEYGEQTDRPSTQVSALNRLAYATATIGADLPRAHSYLNDARLLAESIGDELGLAEYHMNACLVASFAGQIGEAAAHDERTVEIGEKVGSPTIFLSGLVRRAANYTSMVDLEKSEPAVAAALEQTKEAGSDEATAIVEAFGVSSIQYIKGDLRASLETAEGSQSTLERYSSFYMAFNQRNIGWGYYELGDLERALSHFVDAVRLANRSHQGFIGASGASGMALVYATAAMAEQAAEQRAIAETSRQNPLGEFMGSTIFADLGSANLMLGDAHAALADFDRGLEMSSTSQYLERPRLLAGRALARLATDDVAGAEEDLTEAWEFVDGRGYIAPHGLLHFTAGAVHIARDNLEGADEALGAAQERAMDAGQRLLLARILTTRRGLAEQLSDASAARTHAATLMSVIESIAESIAADDLRASFRERWLAPTSKDN